MIKKIFKKNTKKIVKGFSIIEIVTMITIVGILFTAAQAVYAQSVAKSRDSHRITELRHIKDIIDIEVMESGAIFANQAEFSGVLEKRGFAIKPLNDTCYFIASIPAGDSPLGHIEYLVATWGETRSTNSPGEAGVLAIGTNQVMQNILTVKTNKGEEDLSTRLGIRDFSCGDSIRMQKVEKAFLGDPSFELRDDA